MKFFFDCRFTTKFLYTEVVRPLCAVIVDGFWAFRQECNEDPGSFLLQRFDSGLSLRNSPFSLGESNLCDKKLRESLDSLIHLNSAQSKNLFMSSKSSLASTSTLSQFFLLLFLYASFSSSFLGSWQYWNSESIKLSWSDGCYPNGTDCSTHHWWNCLLSICLRVDVWC